MEQFMHEKETFETNPADFCKHAYCPWCGRGQTLADTTARIRISTQCARCGHLYMIDCQTMRTFKVGASPRTYHPKR